MATSVMNEAELCRSKVTLAMRGDLWIALVPVVFDDFADHGNSESSVRTGSATKKISNATWRARKPGLAATGDSRDRSAVRYEYADRQCVKSE